MSIETALAQDSLDRVSRRDPDRSCITRLTVKELSALAPDVRLGEVLHRASARPRSKSLNVDVPAFIMGFDNVIAQNQPGRSQSRISPGTCCAIRTDVLPAKFEQEIVQLLRKNAARAQKEMRPAGSAAWI